MSHIQVPAGLRVGDTCDLCVVLFCDLDFSVDGVYQPLLRYRIAVTFPSLWKEIESLLVARVEVASSGPQGSSGPAPEDLFLSADDNVAWLCCPHVGCA